MRLLLDEMLSPDIAERLRQRGHDAEAIADSPDAALEDPAVLDLARSRKRALVTNNVRDFRPMHVAAVQPGGEGHYGLIFIASNFGRSRSDIGRIVRALEQKLQRYPTVEGLANAEEWL